MRRFLLFLLLFLFLCGYQIAHASGVSTSVVPRSGSPVYVDGKTFIQYLPAHRVTTNPEGVLMVCPPGQADVNGFARDCLDRNKKNTWLYLSNYQQPGYFLQYVQVNETSNGPSLVLFWYPTPETLAADKKKHE